MEDKHQYHGSPLKEDQLAQALEELGIENKLEYYKGEREKITPSHNTHEFHYDSIKIDGGEKISYGADEKIAMRDAYGKALLSLAKANNSGDTKVLAIDCDLAGSTKMNLMQKEVGTGYIQVGIQEHNAAVFAGALTHEGYTVFLSTFGVFGLGECYNQQRLNELNHTRLNLVLTHCGIDVGEDGKTHQAIDYIGVTRNFFNFEAIVPVDGNQMDRAVRYAALRDENVFIGAGRSKYPILTKTDGTPYFDENYDFVYGEDHVIREGKDGAIVALGHTVHFAMEAYELLKKDGIEIAVIAKSCPKTIDKKVMDRISVLPFIMTLEDHNVNTGIGSVVAEYIATTENRPKLVKVGVDRYAPSGKATDLYKLFGMDGESLASRVKELVKGDR
jgi:transketolase